MTMILDYARMLFGLMYGSSAYRVQVIVSNQKFWYITSEILAFITCFIYVFSPLVSRDTVIYYFLGQKVIASLQEVLNSCCKANLVTHLARDNNFADCAAKEGN